MKRAPLSDDARLVQAVQAVARQHRIDDAFFLLRREKPGWTRERWGRAVSETENARLVHLQATSGDNVPRPWGKEGGGDARRGGVRAFDTEPGMLAVPTPA